MPYHHGLETQKYWHQALKQEMKENRRQRSREAIENFKMFLFAVVFIIGVGYAFDPLHGHHSFLFGNIYDLPLTCDSFPEEGAQNTYCRYQTSYHLQAPFGRFAEYFTYAKPVDKHEHGRGIERHCHDTQPEYVLRRARPQQRGK